MPEYDVAALADLIEDTPVKVAAGGRDLVLVRQAGTVHALTHECPHLGLPLSKGVVSGDELMCPFHHACFRLSTGGQTQPPGQGDLARFATAIRDGRVVVDVPDDAPAHVHPRVAQLGPDGRRFVLAGAGAAAHRAAMTLRADGFTGVIEMIAPLGPPRDRTMLSKAVLTGDRSIDDLTLVPEPEAIGVVRIEDRVVAVAPGRVTLAGGGTRAFDRLLVAPGGRPLRLDVPGADLGGIHHLRNAEQARLLAEAIAGARRAVVVGGGFIGAEAAFSLTKRGLAVEIVDRNPLPMRRLLGDRVATVVRDELRGAGIVYRPETEVSSFDGDGQVDAVRLSDGGRIEADLVLVAIGVAPRTTEIDGLPVRDGGGVAVAADLSVPGLDGVHVAGDCAFAPTPFGAAQIEHWRVAQQHGIRAARAMLGRDPADADIPFFWTALARQYRYVGHAEDWDDIAFDGDPDGPFVARYVKDGRVLAALGAGRDRDLASIHVEMRAAGGPIPA